MPDNASVPENYRTRLQGLIDALREDADGDATEFAESLQGVGNYLFRRGKLEMIRTKALTAVRFDKKSACVKTMTDDQVLDFLAAAGATSVDRAVRETRALQKSLSETPKTS